MSFLNFLLLPIGNTHPMLTRRILQEMKYLSFDYVFNVFNYEQYCLIPISLLHHQFAEHFNASDEEKAIYASIHATRLFLNRNLGC